MAVGQKAIDIARFAGLPVKPGTKLLIAEVRGVGPKYPLSVEKLFPVLAVYRAKSVDEALRVCVDVNHAGGLGHTAVIFSRNEEVIRKFSEAMNAGRIIVNSPGSVGERWAECTTIWCRRSRSDAAPVAATAPPITSISITI